MCLIRVRTYRHANGRQESIEEKTLCPKSDGINPCYNHERQIDPPITVGSSLTPNLVYDDMPSPISSGPPGTPVMGVTAGPSPIAYNLVEPPTKAKGKRVVLDVGGVKIKVGDGRKSRPSKTSRKSHSRTGSSSHSHASFDDDEHEDDIVAIEERGNVRPVVPSARRTTSIQGSDAAFSMRQVKPPTIVHQELRTPSSTAGDPNPFITAAGNSEMSEQTDNDLWSRASGRERLRRENRERRVAEESRQTGQQESYDRSYAEQLAREELESAQDEYSLHDYARVQGREQIREMNRLLREEEERKRLAEEQSEEERMQRIADEVRQSRTRQRAEREAARVAAEEAKADQERLRDEARRHEQAAQAMLERVRREEEERKRREKRAERDRQRAAEAAREDERRLRQTQAEIARLEADIAQARHDHERREAHRRLLSDEIKRANRLSEEIRHLEELNRQDDMMAVHQIEQRRLEGQARFGEPSSPRRADFTLPIPYSHYDGPLFGERRALENVESPPSPRYPTTMTTRSPYSDAEFRRQRGEQVLGREEAIGRARAAAEEMQRAVNEDAVQYASRPSTRDSRDGRAGFSGPGYYSPRGRFYPA